MQFYFIHGYNLDLYKVITWHDSKQVSVVPSMARLPWLLFCVGPTKMIKPHGDPKPHQSANIYFQLLLAERIPTNTSTAEPNQFQPSWFQSSFYMNPKSQNQSNRDKSIMGSELWHVIVEICYKLAWCLFPHVRMLLMFLAILVSNIIVL